MKDIEIVDGLKVNDIRAFEYLFHKFQAALCYFAVKIIHHQEAAKEIVSNSFLTIWSRREHFESVENIRSYLYIITRNSCLDYLRFEKRRAQVQSGYQKMIVAHTDVEITKIIIESHFFLKLKQAIEILPPQCREIFKLKYFEELKTSEIAAKLNITQSTVRSQLARAKNLLKLALTKSIVI